MDAVTAPGGLPLLSDYPRFVRRQWGLIALFIAIGLALGSVWAAKQPASFSATASVVLVPVPVYVLPATTGLVPPEVSIDTDAQLVRSPSVLNAVGDALGVDAPRAEQHLSITASPGSHVLHVTVSATSAAVAARAADAAVAAFVDVRRDALGALRSGQLRQLRLFVTDQEEMLAKEQTRRLVIAGEDEMFAQILEMRAGIEELEEARRLPAQVVSPADLPPRADHANAEVSITSGAMLGLLGGWLLAIGRDRARPRDGRAVAKPSEDRRHAR
jgi:uncharacterized protein involved in exopolysaccharide biosynthesis